MSTTYNSRRSLNKCVKCSKQLNDITQARCQTCRNFEQENTKSYQSKRILAHLCRSCCKSNNNGKVHCDICGFKARVRARKRAIELKIMILNAYGGPQCACRGCSWHNQRCVCSHIDVLTIDHIDNSGAKHRREMTGGDRVGGGDTTYRWLKKNNYPSGYQVLCWNCNWIKYKHLVSPQNLDSHFH